MKKKKNSDNKENDLNFLSDSVINVEDAFGIHTKFAEALEEKIIQANVENDSLTIGLFGEWGTGKSVIVEKLHDRITSNRKIAFVKIDVWKYNGLPLLRQIVFEILKQAPINIMSQKEKEKFESEYKKEVMIGSTLANCESKQLRWFKKYYNWIMIFLATLVLISFCLSQIPELSKWITSLLSSFSVSAFTIALGGKIIKSGLLDSVENWFKSVSESILVMEKTIIPTMSPEQFEDVFNRSLLELEEKGIEKFVIVFDNIDRCKGDFAYEVLSSIKTYMCRNHCIYIIPCDDVAIKHYLNREYNDSDCKKFADRNFADEFLDKLFNTYFRIPLIDIIARDKYIEQCISKTILKDIPKIEKIKEILYYAYRGETPRQIVKYINDFISYYEIALKVDPSKKILLDDIETFVVMMSIKQIAPWFEKILITDHDMIRNPQRLNAKSDEENRIKDFLENIQFNFPQDKSVKSYIFLSEVDNEAEQLDALRNGQIFELTDRTAETASNLLKTDSIGDKSLFLMNDVVSCILTMIDYGVDKFFSGFGNAGKPRSFNKFQNTLKDILASTGEYDYGSIYFDRITKTSNENSRIIIESFRLFNKFNLPKKNKETLFNTFGDSPRRTELYELSFIEDGIDFKEIIKETVAKYCYDISGGSEFNDKLLDLLNVLLKKREFALFVNDFKNEIAPKISYEDEKWIDLEIGISSAQTHVKVHVPKIEKLVDTTTTIVKNYRYTTQISSNSSEFEENLQYLSRFEKIPSKFLKSVNNNYEADLEANFSNYLIRLSYYTELSLSMFVLATKIFGSEFVENNFTSGVIAFSEKEKLIEKYCSDKDFLNIMLNSERVAVELLSNQNLLDVILKKSSKQWKIDNLNLFMNNSKDKTCIEKFIESENWDLNEAAEICEAIKKRMIILLKEFAENSNISESTVVDFVDYALSYVGENDRNLFENSKEVLKKVIKLRLNNSMSFYEVFKKYKFNEQWFFAEIFEFLLNSSDISTIDLTDVGKVVSELEELDAIENHQLLVRISEKFVDLANVESVTNIGVKALSVLADSGYDYSKYESKLLLIKEKNICVIDIDNLLAKLTKK